MGKIKDITGQKFGKLTPIKPTDKRSGRSIIWLCKCDCGNEKEITSRHLIANKTISCGCALIDAGIRSIKNLKGLKCGQLTVLNLAARKNHRTRWNCKCSCGTKCVILTSSLLNEKTKSCGCLRGKQIKAKSEIEGKSFKEITGDYWGHVKTAAKVRNIPFEITPQEAWDQWTKQQGICALSGTFLCFAKNKKERKKQTASIDRINSKEGYTKENIQWVHKDINRMKWELTDQQFIDWCIKISKFRGNK